MSDLKTLKYLVQKHREQGKKLVEGLKKLQDHAAKMEEYYTNWEFDFVAIQKAIDEAKEKHGIPQEEIEEIEEFNALDDLLGDENG